MIKNIATTIIASLFAISAAQANPLNGRDSPKKVDCDQILTVTDELESEAERITVQFSTLDQDTQVGHWQRCNQWQP
jgi:hypothetical protein